MKVTAGGARPAGSPQTARNQPHATHGLPYAGSLNGIGGSCQVPVDGGRTLASTCTSITHGRLLRSACSTAPARSSLRVTVVPSAPLARAQAAKSGLYGLLRFWSR